jgi:peptide chain release factor 1
MLQKLEKIVSRYEEIERSLSDPDIVRDRERMAGLGKEYKELESIVKLYHRLKRVSDDLETAREMLNESTGDDKALIEAELAGLEEEHAGVELEVKRALIPKDPDSDKSVIIEIRAGTGGEEAGLFVADLFRMYTRYAEIRGWDWEILSSNETGIGGFKEVVFSIKGKGAYERLRFEAGTHRVQRVPVTESSGRIHTSAVTVAVLIEPDEVDEINIDPDDLRIDTYRSSSAGGQHVNKTDSAVRITHMPSGIVVSCQDQRSQHQNKERAMRLLKAYLLENERAKRARGIAADRKSQVGSGDRSERIRTYNFPQTRVTDHRVNVTLKKLPQVLEGDLDEIIDALIFANEAKQLSISDED